MGVASLLGGDVSEPTLDFIAYIISKVDANAFNVMDPVCEDALGVALYGGASLINHSCDPNALVLFDGKRLFVRTVYPLKPGEQVRRVYQVSPFSSQ